MTTGCPPGLLQDDSRKLSDWFASRIDARWTVRQVCAEIERNRMTDKQPEALRIADAVFAAIPWVPAGAPARKTLGDAAALLRTQHAAIERKDALLRQACEAMDKWNREQPGFACEMEAALYAITKELQ